MMLASYLFSFLFIYTSTMHWIFYKTTNASFTLHFKVVFFFKIPGSWFEDE